MTIVTPNDHGPLVNVAMWIALAPMIIVTGTKIYTKWASNQNLQLDDLFMLFSMLVAVAQSVATTEQVHYGLGRNQYSLTESQIDSFYLSEYVAQLLYVVAIFSAKLIGLQFYILLADPHRQIPIVKASIYFVLLWVFIAIFAAPFQCHPPYTWLVRSGGCIDKSTFWVFNSIVDIATQLMVGLLPAFLLRKLHANRATKLLSMLAFTPNLLIIPLSIIRLVFLFDVRSSNNYTWDSFALATVTALHAILSVLVAGLPFSKSIIDSFVLLPIVIKDETSSYNMSTRNRSTVKDGIISVPVSSRLQTNNNPVTVSLALWPQAQGREMGNFSNVITTSRVDWQELHEYST